MDSKIIEKHDLELTDKSINDTSFLGIDIYKIKNSGFYLMQYDPKTKEDLRDKDLIFIFLNSFGRIRSIIISKELLIYNENKLIDLLIIKYRSIEIQYEKIKKIIN